MWDHHEVLCTPSILRESSPPRLSVFGLWSFPIVSRPLPDSKALCRQLQVVIKKYIYIFSFSSINGTILGDIVTTIRFIPYKLLKIILVFLWVVGKFASCLEWAGKKYFKCTILRAIGVPEPLCKTPDNGSFPYIFCLLVLF